MSKSLIMRLRCRVADLRGRGVYAGWANEHRAIFIHLPKTAGTSMSQALGLPPRHIPAEQYRIANPAKFSRFFKFAFVRNPYDRLLSSYSFLKGGGMNAVDRRFAEAYVKPYESFQDFVIEGLSRRPEIQEWVHFRPQSTFICDPQGRNLMDFTGRFERIAEDYTSIAARLGKSEELSVINRSQRGNYREAYTPAMIDIVRSMFKRDLETFQYEFD